MVSLVSCVFRLATAACVCITASRFRLFGARCVEFSSLKRHTITRLCARVTQAPRPPCNSGNQSSLERPSRPEPVLQITEVMISFHTCSWTRRSCFSAGAVSQLELLSGFSTCCPVSSFLVRSEIPEGRGSAPDVFSYEALGSFDK